MYLDIFTRKFHIDAIGIYIVQKENDTYLYIVCTSSENLTTVAIYIYIIFKFRDHIHTLFITLYPYNACRCILYESSGYTTY